MANIKKLKIDSTEYNIGPVIEAGTSNGSIKVNGTDVAITGLGTAAYEASTAFAAATHNQASSTINAMTGYTKASAAAAISASDTLNVAIGKLEYKADNVNITALTQSEIDTIVDSIIPLVNGDVIAY